MLRLALIVGLVVAPVTIVLPAAHAQSGDRLEDPDYCFRIESPGSEWTILDEPAARDRSPIAVGGMFNLRGVQYLVTAEATPKTDLDEVVRLVQAASMLDSREFSASESLTFQGLPARRWTGRGSLNGIAYRLQFLLFLRDGFAFKLVGSAPAREAPTAELGLLERQFVLTPGGVRARPQVVVHRNDRGPGWRLQDGVYQNASYGFEVRAPDGWRFVIGDELLAARDTACVGLVCLNPEAYVEWTLERARGVEETAYCAQMVPDFVAGTVSSAPVPTSMLGLSFPLVRRDLPTANSLVHFDATRVREGMGVHVRAWYRSSFDATARPELDRALNSGHFLDANARASLARELDRLGDPENEVGVDCSVRNRVFRSFDHGFTWMKPAGFWTVDGGERARARHPDASMVVHCAEQGVTGTLIVTSGVEIDPRVHHDLIVDGLGGTPVSREPRAINLGGTQALLTVSEAKINSLDVTYFIVSLVRDTRAFQFVLLGLTGNVAAARSSFDAAITGLRVPKAVPRLELTDTAVTDHRLGFRLRKPSGTGWRFEDHTPPDISPIGSMLAYRSEEVVVTGAAMCVPDVARVRQSIIDALEAEARADPEWAPMVETQGMLGGLPARRIVLSGAWPAVVRFIERDRTLYYLTIQAEKPVDSAAERELAGLFELID